MQNRTKRAIAMAAGAAIIGASVVGYVATNKKAGTKVKKAYNNAMTNTAKALDYTANNVKKMKK